MIREAKVVTCCPEKRFCLLDGKYRNKSPVHLFELNFLHNVLYTIVKLRMFLVFYLSCRSSPKKFSTTCCFVFHIFCHVLSFLSFANLKLDFSLQKPFGNLEKQ